jgi:proline dehydrogenase
VATHDEALVRVALQRLRAAGTPCELELLFGLPAAAAAHAADELSAPVRVYVPYGHATLPYRIPDARRDTRILGWFSQDVLWGRGKGWRELSHRLRSFMLPLGLATDAASATPPSGSRRHARA